MVHQIYVLDVKFRTYICSKIDFLAGMVIYCSDHILKNSATVLETYLSAAIQCVNDHGPFTAGTDAAVNRKMD